MGQHGGDIYSEEIQKQIAKEDRKFLDFSANINPLGMPAGVRLAVMEALDKAEHYPDPESRKLKHALAEYHEVPEEALICGNGGADLIYRLAYGTKPAHALLTAPTFLEYEEALKQVGTKIHIYEMQPDYRVREDILEQMTEDMDVMFLCNPNNPTGFAVEREALIPLLEYCEERGIVCVVDECFIEFLDEPERFSVMKEVRSGRFRRLFILKAFTKLYAMAGLRLGYGISLDRELLEAMDGCRQPWSVSGPAQSAGEAALGETEYVNRARELVKRERSWLKAQMEGLGLFVYDSRANYLFFRDPAQARARTPEACSLYDACLKNGVLIRSCANYRGLDGRFYRICVKDRANNETFIRVLKKAMEERD